MRYVALPGFAISVLFLFGPSLRADDAANEIIKQAIAARGGEEKLNKIKAYKETTKGTISIMGMDLDFTSESTVAPPKKIKTTAKMEVGGNAVTFEQVINGDKAKVTVNGMDVPVEDSQKADSLQRLRLTEAMKLTPLLADKSYDLKSLGESKVDGKDVVGVQVSSKNLKDTKMYFDKTTHLLVKTEHQGLDPTGKSAKQETFASDYKEFDGVKQPTKVLIKNDGEKFMEFQITEFKVLEKVDDKDLAD